MGALGPLAFTAPWLLVGLAALPVLWWLLRAVPPAPLRRRFPAVTLLLGLRDAENESDRTPWWLLALRCLAVAAVVVGFAGPVLNPQETPKGGGPVLIVADASWASAQDWSVRRDRLEELVDAAGRAGRPVAVTQAGQTPDDSFQSADVWRQRLEGLELTAWEPNLEWLIHWVKRPGRPGFDTWWLSDGVARDGHTELLEEGVAPEGRAELLAALEAHGDVTVFESAKARLALGPAEMQGDAVVLPVMRTDPAAPASVTLRALGPGPNGVVRELARLPVRFEAGALRAEARFTLPGELRNRIRRFEIEGLRSAGATSLTGFTLKRQKVGLMAAQSGGEAGKLLSPLHYLKQALEPSADIVEGTLDDILLSAPDVIVLADIARLTTPEAEALQGWVSDGGTLLRFAGPRVAASDISRDAEDPLMPVRLRVGGRSVGGAMSWGEPRHLRPFPEGSPFYGLSVPDDVTVTSQVVAQPDPELAGRVIAALSDGTPLVTRKALGRGRVVLFHVTANAEWSTLPLSGLFVQMLERLAVAGRGGRPSAEDLRETSWVAAIALDAFGVEHDRRQTMRVFPSVYGEDMAAGVATSFEQPPGLYVSDDQDWLAINVFGWESTLAPAVWPAGTHVEPLGGVVQTRLKGAFLVAALLLLMVDILATLALGGRLFGRHGGVAKGTGGAAALVFALALSPGLPGQADAGDAGDSRAIRATSETVLAYVLTGERRVDEVSAAGLRGLSLTLTLRTSVEPSEPIGIDLETDELAFFPFIYWPITTTQPLPSREAYARLNRYLRTGGMILFDTRDADIGGFGSGTPNGRRLRQLAASLDIPPLEPVPPDHVLTRAFYLLSDFPGRFASRDVWVEAAPPGAERAEGMPFRDLNDGVTPVVIGGNDWAAAWAVNEAGDHLFPVGRGFAGERQREFALRFGVNLVMYVLTGNYKSDQVHVPALLERLGQ